MKNLLFACLFASSLGAQTTISDTLYSPIDGGLFHGDRSQLDRLVRQFADVSPDLAR